MKTTEQGCSGFQKATEIERRLTELAHAELAFSLWEQSQRAHHPAVERFLESSKVRLACDRLAFPPDLIQALVASAERIVSNRLLTRYAWFCHKAITDPNLAETVIALPTPNDDPLFFALILLSALPSLTDFYQTRNISSKVLQETISDLLLWIRHYHEKNGRWGLAETRWLIKHFTGKVFRLGRLQFELSKLHRPWYIFQNRSDASHQLLAAHGQLFRHDGQFANADNINDLITWESTLSISETAAAGCPVNSHGNCEQRKIVLSFDDWKLTGKPADPMIAVHIPAIGPLDPLACKESFNQAPIFFKQHFPEFAAVAYSCESWLLDPQLEKILPRESNIVKFLKLWVLYPVLGANSNQTYERVFGSTTWPPNAKTVRTSLQKSIVEIVKNGGQVRMGGGFIFPD